MRQASDDNSGCLHDLLSYALKVVCNTPDVRQERVASAKRALRNGTLPLKGEELAEKLLELPLHEVK
jgi:anti-sigma28 factor (negative regulator of flagellin synthesis)